MKQAAVLIPRPLIFRLEVKDADDTSNFEDYSDLPEQTHDFQLSLTEQMMFEGI